MDEKKKPPPEWGPGHTLIYLFHPEGTRIFTTGGINRNENAMAVSTQNRQLSMNKQTLPLAKGVKGTPGNESTQIEGDTHRLVGPWADRPEKQGEKNSPSTTYAAKQDQKERHRISGESTRQQEYFRGVKSPSTSLSSRMCMPLTTGRSSDRGGGRR